MATTEDLSLGRRAVERGLISAAELDSLLGDGQKPLADLLLERGYLTPRQLHELLGTGAARAQTPGAGPAAGQYGITRHATPTPRSAGPGQHATPAPTGAVRKTARSTSSIRRDGARAGSQPPGAPGAPRPAVPVTFYVKLGAIAGCLVLLGVAGTVLYLHHSGQGLGSTPPEVATKGSSGSEPNPPPDPGKAAVSRPDKPAVAPGEVAARDRLAEIRSALGAAGDDPARLLEVQELFARFHKRFRTEPWESLAAEDEQRFQAHLEDLAAAQAKAKEGKLSVLLTGGRLTAAATLCRDLPEVFRGTKAAERAQARATALEAQVTARYPEDLAAVTNFLRSDSFDEAEEVLGRIVLYGTEQMAAEAERIRQEIGAARARRRAQELAAGAAKGPVVRDPKAPAAAPAGPDLETVAAPEPKPIDLPLAAALRWLARHQEADGSWDPERFASQCQGRPCGGAGYQDYHIGLTGLSLLAFLGAGYSHGSRDKYKDPVTGQEMSFGAVVKSALRRLLSAQAADGGFGPGGGKMMYNHAIAALALAEAYGLSASPALKDPAQRALRYLVAAQNPGKAWRYDPHSGEDDSSVTGWCVRALRAGAAAGLEVDRSAFSGARSFIDSITEKNYGKCGYRKLEDAGVKVVVQGRNGDYANHEALTAVGMVCRMLVDGQARDPLLELGAKLMIQDLPRWDKAAHTNDYYYWHYATHALHGMEGPNGRYTRAWDAALVKALVPNQRNATDGCAAGSWDADDRWGFEGGRVYATAINALTLESRSGYGINRGPARPPGRPAGGAEPGPAGAAAGAGTPPASGAQLQPCPTCHGRRICDEPCGSCKGQGKVPCFRCEGSGSIPCSACKSRSFDPGASAPCVVCGASGRTKCPACGGAKTLTCPECDGERKVRVPCSACNGLGRVRGTRPPPANPADCTECRGSGLVECRTCGGSGREERNCPDCVRGNRLCGACSGEWLSFCQACRGTGRSATTGKTCASCNGSGRSNQKCPSCASGWTRCTTCQGKASLDTCRSCSGAKQVPCPACR